MAGIDELLDQVREVIEDDQGPRIGQINIIIGNSGTVSIGPPCRDDWPPTRPGGGGCRPGPGEAEKRSNASRREARGPVPACASRESGRGSERFSLPV